MEEIIIKSIEKKDSGLVIVGYNGNREATMNTKWQAQEVDYFEKDVGIGGRVKCLIVQKGDYTNITKVDFASAVKNEGAVVIDRVADAPQVEAKLMSVKEIGMCAGGMLKCYYYQRKAEDLDEVYEAYHYFVKKLEENG